MRRLIFGFVVTAVVFALVDAVSRSQVSAKVFADQTEFATRLNSIKAFEHPMITGSRIGVESRSGFKRSNTEWLMVAPDVSSYVGKYPSDVFRQNPQLKKRLHTLLGANYTFFMDRMQVEAPFDKDGDAIVSTCCMAHSCGIEEAILAITTADGKISCAILSDKFGGKYKVYSEDSAHIPDALNHKITK